MNYSNPKTDIQEVELLHAVCVSPNKPSETPTPPGDDFPNS